MKANISIGECIIRILVGMVFAAIFGGVFTGFIAMNGLLSIYPIVTGLGGWDPIFGAMKKYTNEDCPYEDEGIVEHSVVAEMVQAPRQKLNAAA